MGRPAGWGRLGLGAVLKYGRKRFPQTLHGFVVQAPNQSLFSGSGLELEKAGIGGGRGSRFQNNAADQPEPGNVAPALSWVCPEQPLISLSPASSLSTCSFPYNLELLFSFQGSPHPQPFSFPSSIPWPGLSLLPSPPGLISLARVLDILERSYILEMSEKRFK